MTETQEFDWEDRDNIRVIPAEDFEGFAAVAGSGSASYMRRSRAAISHNRFSYERLLVKFQAERDPHGNR